MYYLLRKQTNKRSRQFLVFAESEAFHKAYEDRIEQESRKRKLEEIAVLAQNVYDSIL